MLRENTDFQLESHLWDTFNYSNLNDIQASWNFLNDFVRWTNCLQYK